MDVPKIFDLSGKRAIVTGGGVGLGRQIAEGLAGAGANLMLCGRKVERCEETATDVADRFGVTAIAHRCDVRDGAEIDQVVAATVAGLGGVDILVNNSGTSWGAPAVDYPLEAWEKVIEVNLTGSLLFTQAAARQMMKQGTGGRVVNIASVLGLRGAPAEMVDAVGYNASKGGVLAMTRDLAVKWADQGISVNAIAPGWFRTDMSTEVIDRNAETFLQRIPMQRFGGTDDLKGVAVFLASPAADYVTGQTIVVDGGQSIS
jgi:gluconate 5-dehydrogenase